MVFGKGGGEGADARGKERRGSDTGGGGGEAWIEEEGDHKPNRTCGASHQQHAQGGAPTQLAFERAACEPQPKEVEREVDPRTVQERIRKGSPHFARLERCHLEGQGGFKNVGNKKVFRSKCERKTQKGGNKNV